MLIILYQINKRNETEMVEQVERKTEEDVVMRTRRMEAGEHRKM